MKSLSRRCLNINEAKLGYNMRAMAKLVATSTTVFLLSACLSNETSENEPAESDTITSMATESEAAMPATQTMQLSGTIEYQNFEGGFYGFIAKDGKKYTLHKLPPEHRRHGLVVKVIAEPMTDMATTTQFGELVKVLEIEVLDESKVRPVVKNNEM